MSPKNTIGPSRDWTVQFAPCYSPCGEHILVQHILVLKYDKKHFLSPLFEGFLDSTWPDLSDLLALSRTAPLTHSCIINVIMAPHDLHHNMEINIPPSRVQSLSLNPATSLVKCYHMLAPAKGFTVTGPKSILYFHIPTGVCGRL